MTREIDVKMTNSKSRYTCGYRLINERNFFDKVLHVYVSYDNQGLMIKRKFKKFLFYEIGKSSLYKNLYADFLIYQTLKSIHSEISFCHKILWRKEKVTVALNYE